MGYIDPHYDAFCDSFFLILSDFELWESMREFMRHEYPNLTLNIRTDLVYPEVTFMRGNGTYLSYSSTPVYEAVVEVCNTVNGRTHEALYRGDKRVFRYG